jgi:lia operon protein LiaG
MPRVSRPALRHMSRAYATPLNKDSNLQVMPTVVSGAALGCIPPFDQDSIMRVATLALMLALPSLTHGQSVERVTLEGSEVAIYNLVGRLRVEGGSGSSVVVEVTRVGREASRLKLEKGEVRGRMALRVRYPEDRILYSDQRWNGRTTFNVADDGTWGDSQRGGYDRRRIEVSSRGDGVDAHADLHVIVPKGKSLVLRQGVGETTIDNVDGKLSVDVSSSRVRASHVRGSLQVDAGSGGVELTDITGDLSLDSGSGGTTIDGVRGGRLKLEIGSGSLRGRDVDVSEITADVGSGGVRLSAVKSPRIHLEAGSGGADLELLTSPDDVNIEAGSGGVTLRMPAATSAYVDIETGSGGVDSDFEVKLSRIEKHALHGTIGSGKGRIKIEAGSGHVRLMRS